VKRFRRIAWTVLALVGALLCAATLFTPYWGITLLFGIIPTCWLAGAVVRVRRRAWTKRLGLCPSCGYELRATPEKCPECGAMPKAKGAM